ncbi:MAG: hypothetical protein IJU40_06160 [Desulfovibrionaceae bacterium]|nr:hypothetical protein [Desulfovibrionaceae bacterium]
MQKKSYLGLTLICGLLIALILGAQMILKPQIEQTFSQMFTRELTANGLTLVGPLKVKLNIFNRTLHIEPYTLKMKAPIEGEAKFYASRINLTFKGMLAASSLADYVLPKEGVVPFYSLAECEGFAFISKEGELHLEKPQIKNLAVEAKHIKPWISGEMPIKKVFCTIEQMILPKNELSIQTEDAFTLQLGEINFSDLTPKQIKSFKIKDLEALQKKNLVFSLREFQQKDVHILSEKESIDLGIKLGTANDVQKSIILADLLMGDNPVVDETHFKGFKLLVDKEFVDIGGIDLICKGENQEKLLALKDIVINRKSLESLGKNKLPIPETLLLSLGFKVANQKNNLKKFKINLGIKELFDLNLSVNAKAKNFKDLWEKIEVTPFRDLNLTFTDQSLLARIGYFFAPKASAKDFFLSSLKGDEKVTEVEKELREKLSLFVSQPGSLILTSVKGKTCTSKSLDKMSPDEALQLFKLEVKPGSQDLDAQVQSLKLEAN